MSLNLHLATEENVSFDLFQTSSQTSRDICGREDDKRENVLERYAVWVRAIPNLREADASQHLLELLEFLERNPTAYFFIM